MMKKILFAAIVALGFTFVGPAHAQQVRVVTTCGSVSPYHALNPGSITTLYVDPNGNICGGGGGGGGGGTSSSFGAAFPATGTAAGFEYLSSPPTLTSGQMVAGQTDVNGNVKVNCVTGCSGGGGSGGSTPQTTTGAAINVSTATTTSIITHTTGDFTYITAFNINTPSTGTVQLEYGTGSLCGTGTTVITGQYSLATQGGISLGSGFGTALPPVPVSNDVCMVTTGGSVNAQGSISYTQSSTALASFGGGGGGLSVTDQTAFTYGTSPFTPIGCVYNSSITALTSGNQGALACNANRAAYIDVLAGSNFATLLANGVFTIGTGTALPASAVAVGGQDINSHAIPVPIDPCSQAKSYFDLETTTGTGTQLVAGVSGKKIYICAGTSMITSAAAHLSLIEGASTTCTTPVSVYGNTGTVAAASGMAFAANGGISLTGNTPAATQTTGNSLCILFDTTNSPQVNVHVAYVQE